MALSITVGERTMNANSRKRESRGNLLTNNTTYAAGGLALPAKEQFGFVRNMDTFVVLGEDSASATQYLLSWDKSANKLQFFEEEAVAAGGPLLEAAAAAVGTRTYRYVATGW